ncbi:MAG: PleD family two-component system response regulator [Pseudomonadota bacterium]
MTGRVMIVEDSATNRMVLKAKLTQAYYDVVEAEDGETALEMVLREDPDLILLDIMMPGIDGFEVCRQLKLDPRTLHIPVIIQTALDGREDRVRGLEAGADDFLTKSPDDTALMGRVDSLVRMKVMVDELALRGQTNFGIGNDRLLEVSRATHFHDSHVMVVSTCANAALQISECLQDDVECKLAYAAGAAEAMRLFDENNFDAVVIDGNASDGDPLRLGVMIHARPESRQTAVLLIVNDDSGGVASRALSLGINDYLSSPVDLSELVARTRSQLRRKNYADLLRENMRSSVVDANTDALTGCYNRRYTLPYLDAQIDTCRKREAQIAVIMLDLDRFKSVNDRYGHSVGDQVLKEFAERLSANVRSVDLVARLGGEEFMVVMPDAQGGLVSEIAERVRQAVADPPFRVSHAGCDEDILITVSIGYAILTEHETADAAMHRADVALYDSKNGGRNRVTEAKAA